jgi:signal transduction histidine kinase
MRNTVARAGFMGLAEIDRRLACANQAIDLALAMRDRGRFHRACEVRSDLLTLRAERERAELFGGQNPFEERRKEAA